MWNFSDAILLDQLRSLPSSCVAAFAACCAVRISERIAMSDVDACLRDGITAMLTCQCKHTERLEAIQREIEKRIVRANDSENMPMENMLTALHYSIQCCVTENAECAVVSARRAYEAADRQVSDTMDVDINTIEGEYAIRTHPVVQRELEYQQKDILTFRGYAEKNNAQMVCALACQYLRETGRKYGVETD